MVEEVLICPLCGQFRPIDPVELLPVDPLHTRPRCPRARHIRIRHQNGLGVTEEDFQAKQVMLKMERCWGVHALALVVEAELLKVA